MMRLFLLIILSIVMTCSWAEARYPFTNPKQQVRFQSLLHELRCPVCQNQDLADSNASVAVDLRQEVYRRILMNQSDQDIIQYVTSRYGDFILFKPPLRTTTMILWFGPIVLLGAGLCMVAVMFRRKAHHD